MFVVSLSRFRGRLSETDLKNLPSSLKVSIVRMFTIETSDASETVKVVLWCPFLVASRLFSLIVKVTDPFEYLTRKELWDLWGAETRQANEIMKFLTPQFATTDPFAQLQDSLVSERTLRSWVQTLPSVQTPPVTMNCLAENTVWFKIVNR